MSVMCSPMGGVGWPVGLALTLGFWGLVVWAGVMLFRTFTGGHHYGASSLARRYAAGDIEEDEYRRRLAVLRDPRGTPSRERL